MQRKKLDPRLLKNNKQKPTNPKWIKDQNLRTKMIELLEENFNGICEYETILVL